MTVERFIWTIHAEERLRERGVTRDVVERAIQEGHSIREPNDGEADWRIDASRFVVVYDYPHREDIGAVCIVSVWSKHRRRRRGLSGYPA